MHMHILPLRPVSKVETIMAAFTPYALPILGLKVGTHSYQYVLDDAFFALFEDAPIQHAHILVDLKLDKRSDMLLLDFATKGRFQTSCDRCTATIMLPIEDRRTLFVKYGDAEGEEEDEVVFISREASHFNVAKYLYEFSVLAMPLTNVYDCQSEAQPPCNRDILSYLNPDDTPVSTRESVWDALKKGKF